MRGDPDLGVADPLLRARGDRHAQPPGERRGALGVAEVRRDHHGVGQVPAAEVGGELAQRVQVVHRDGEEPVHLRRVQGQREHSVHARGDQQVGHQSGADGDPRLVLLVRPAVRVVRYHRGHPGGRRAAGRVRHQQQLDQVLLHRPDQRLDEEHVPFPAVGLELDLQAVVREPLEQDRLLRHGQERADLGGQRRVSAAAEHRDLTHSRSPGTRGTPRARAAAPAAPARREAELLPDLGLDDLRRGPRVHGDDVLLAPEQVEHRVGLLVVGPQPDRQRLLGVILPGASCSPARVALAGDRGAAVDQVVVDAAAHAQPAVEHPAADLAVRQVQHDDPVDVVGLQEELGLAPVPREPVDDEPEVPVVLGQPGL